jgi:outer membrane immunogenic protein
MPFFSWTGCYVGVHAGGGVMKDTATESNLFSGGGGLAGGQAGCNYQINQLVIGVEGEAWWSGVSNKSNYSAFDPYTLSSGYAYFDNSTERFKNKWDADLALRVGYAFDRVLLYGKAGVAVGGFNFSNNYAYGYTYPNSPASSYGYANTQNGSNTLYGMLLGIGLEWAFLDNWTTKIEADYINFVAGDLPIANCQTGTGSSSSPTSCGTRTFSVSASKLLVKLGLNYKFGGPVVAKY